MKTKLILAIILVLFIVLPFNADAQCAMCRATAESGIPAEGGDIAQGLNKGILYLMSIPYILIGTIGFFWYRLKKQKAQA